MRTGLALFVCVLILAGCTAGVERQPVTSVATATSFPTPVATLPVLPTPLPTRVPAPTTVPTLAPTAVPTLPAVSTPEPRGNWMIERVDTPRLFADMGSRSLALDANGRPHIAYGEGFLYYAWHDGSQWQIETVDSAGSVGQYTSLALDAAGRPHISYYDANNEDLKYAYLDGSSWQIETVDSAGSVGEYTSLALDAAGRPHRGRGP